MILLPRADGVSVHAVGMGLGGFGFFGLEDFEIRFGDFWVEFFAGLLFQDGADLLGGVAVHAHFFAALNHGQNMAAQGDLVPL